ncbi:MAG: AsmA family protein, partial [Burkholderiales bacterium]|nr:AsmA family protein [Burkholderiales bacterium]
PIRMTPGGYELQGLSARVGQSRLGGSGRLDLSGPRPQLQMQVAAETLQLDDFPAPQRLTDEPGPDRDAAGLRASAGRLAGRTDRLLSAGFLRRFDASVDVQAREVLSGADRLADGRLHLELQQGRLNLDPAVVNLPGGGLRLAMVYDLKGAQLDFELAAAIERFDYGIIARRQHRTADLRGLFSLDMKIKGTAPSLDALLPYASGHLDFAVWPTELRSGVFSTWSSNLVLTLLPLIDPRADPQINCIVGRFDLQDGNLAAETMLIDTTSVRIRGEGAAHLATEQLGFVFRPRAKGIGLLRLQTPLRVGGTLYDQRFYFTQGDVLESVLRLIASPVLLPIERLRHGPQARDGTDVCTDPLRAAGG